MKLDNITYSEFVGQPDEWKLDSFSFGDINLIVGPNATGKSRTLNVIFSLALLLSKKGELPFTDGEYKVLFSDESNQYKYSLIYKDKLVLKEEFYINETMYLTREKDGEGEIYFRELDKFLKFQTPQNEIAAVARRDNIQHPFLEILFNWADKCVKYLFGEKMGKDSLLVMSENEELKLTIDYKETEKATGFFLAGQNSLGPDYMKSVIKDMETLDYRISEIGTDSPQGISIKSNIPSDIIVSKMQGIFVKEHGLEAMVFQHKMSQGMFRALSLLIQLNYILMIDNPQTILIDDIGEGLDYLRSTLLIKLLIKKSKENDVQLIMTSNDQFVMNGVPIEYWFIIQRKGSVCTGINYRNSKEIFDNFQLTGLNNFDMLTTNYFLNSKINN